MALILKSGQTFTYSGQTYNNAYLIVTSALISKYVNSGETSYQLLNDRLSYPITVIVSIYKDKDDRINGVNALTINIHTLNIRDKVIFNNIFSMNNMSDVNIFKKSYEFISNYYPNWKSDE